MGPSDQELKSNNRVKEDSNRDGNLLAFLSIYLAALELGRSVHYIQHTGLDEQFH